MAETMGRCKDCRHWVRVLRFGGKTCETGECATGPFGVSDLLPVALEEVPACVWIPGFVPDKDFVPKLMTRAEFGCAGFEPVVQYEDLGADRPPPGKSDLEFFERELYASLGLPKGLRDPVQP